MNFLILNNVQAEKIATLNASSPPDRQLTPAAMLDGRCALNADLLQDAGPGQTWSHFGTALAAFTPAPLAEESFAVAPDLLVAQAIAAKSKLE